MTLPSDAADLLGARAVQVAPLLLGAVLRSDLAGGSVGVRITEVEAYEGADDPASHAYRGRTARTAVMFGPAGRLYCYFVYGMHWCANVVTGADGTASAVLLRAGVVIDGLGTVRRRAAATSPAASLTGNLASGPARLARALGLTGSDTGADLLAVGSSVRLESLSEPLAHLSGPRVGISVATQRPWRFWLPDEPSVSRFRPAARRRTPTRQTDVS